MLITWVLRKIEYPVLIYNHNFQNFENVKLSPEILQSFFGYVMKTNESPITLE
jgi:hypothetical protein